MDKDCTHQAWLDHQERYFLALQYIKPGDLILDAATGAGYGINFLSKNSGCRKAIGLDISDHALQWTELHFGLESTSFIKADLNKDIISLLPDQKYNVITSFETIEHLQNPRPFLEPTICL